MFTLFLKKAGKMNFLGRQLIEAQTYLALVLLHGSVSKK